jgi:hypothetical protein
MEPQIDSLAALDGEKIRQRQVLLRQDAAQAQAIANQTLHAHLWAVETDAVWEDTLIALPTNLECVMAKVAPETLKSILETIQAAGIEIVVVGGQAINLWAVQYSQSTPDWEQLQPYASEDLEIYGGRLEAVQCAEALNGKLTLARDFDPSPNAEVVTIDWQGSQFRIDILSSVYGLSDAEISATALRLRGLSSLSNVELKVLHPVLCLESKLKCLRDLDQQLRQDEKHVRLALLILRSLLITQLETQPPRGLLNLVERIVNNTWTDAALYAWYRFDIRVETAIPIEVIQQHPAEQWQNFVQIRWPQILERLTERRTRYENLMQRVISEG